MKLVEYVDPKYLSKINSDLFILPIVEGGEVHEVAKKWIQEWLEKDLRGRLRQNYTRQNLDIDSHLHFHVLVYGVDYVPVSFCGVYNGGRYLPHIYRLMNRSYVFSQFRNNGLFKLINSRFLLPFQMSKLDKNKSDYFVSRQGVNGAKFLKWWRQRVQLVADWEIPEGLFFKVANGQSKSSYQSIAYKTHDSSRISLPFLGAGEWAKLIN